MLYQYESKNVVLLGAWSEEKLLLVLWHLLVVKDMARRRNRFTALFFTLCMCLWSGFHKKFHLPGVDGTNVKI